MIDVTARNPKGEIVIFRYTGNIELSKTGDVLRVKHERPNIDGYRVKGFDYFYFRDVISIEGR